MPIPGAVAAAPVISGPILGAIGSIGGAILGGIFGKSSAKAKNKADMARLREANRFTKEMSSTAYQRAMADMKTAGLNPILAYKQGGASGGQGAFTPSVEELGAGVSSAMGAMKFAQELKNLKATERNIETSTLNTAYQADMNMYNANLLSKDSKFANDMGVTPAFAGTIPGKIYSAVQLRKATRSYGPKIPAARPKPDFRVPWLDRLYEKYPGRKK